MYSLLYTMLKRPFYNRGGNLWQWPTQTTFTPADWVSIQISSKSGGQLSGIFRRTHQENAKGTIVCAHPYGHAAKGFFFKHGHARMFLDGGYNVLLFDFNGFGQSSIGNFEFPLDVIAAGYKAVELAPDLPVGLHGVSFGAAWSICALSQYDHPFSTCIAEGTFTTLEEYWMRNKWAFRALRTLSLAQPRLANRLRPIDQIKAIRQGNMLLLYSTGDETTSESMGHRLYDACGLPEEQKRLTVFQDAPHTKYIEAHPLGYRQTVLNFLGETLPQALPTQASA
jgi:alpha-beta hydrolase superfamily lysophospholipase